MEDEQRSFWPTILRWSACICLFLLLAYVLSIGPVVGSSQTPEGLPLVNVEPLTALYAPILWVSDHNVFLGNLLRKYIQTFTPDFDDS